MHCLGNQTRIDVPRGGVHIYKDRHSSLVEHAVRRGYKGERCGDNQVWFAIPDSMASSADASRDYGQMQSAGARVYPNRVRSPYVRSHRLLEFLETGTNAKIGGPENLVDRFDLGVGQIWRRHGYERHVQHYLNCPGWERCRGKYLLCSTLAPLCAAHLPHNA